MGLRSNGTGTVRARINGSQESHPGSTFMADSYYRTTMESHGILCLITTVRPFLTQVFTGRRKYHVMTVGSDHELNIPPMFQINFQIDPSLQCRQCGSGYGSLHLDNDSNGP